MQSLSLQRGDVLPQHFSNTPLEIVMRAAAFAADAHRDQKRKTKDEPYIGHLTRVASMAAQAGLCAEAIAAGLLHDVVEDTDVTLSEIQAAFPERVAELVGLLTQWWPEDAPARMRNVEERKYLRGVLTDCDAVSLKLLERVDNMRDLAASGPRFHGWAQRYLRRTERSMRELVKACHNDFIRALYFQAVEDLRLAIPKGARWTVAQPLVLIQHTSYAADLDCKNVHHPI